jgi:molybdenum cofactor cytidylyltransferase
MKFGSVAVAQSEGAILAHSVGGLKKGRKISAADVLHLVEQQVAKVTVAQIEASDVPEDDAALALSLALAGRQVDVQAPFTGRANLFAKEAGLVVIDEVRLNRLNRIHESITVACLKALQRVDARQMVATVKIIPFATPRKALNEALAVLAEGPLLYVSPFQQKRVGLVITKTTSTKASIVAKSEKAIADRLVPKGSMLAEVIVCEHNAEAIATALQKLKDFSPLLVFGAAAIVDRQDVVPQGLVEAGGQVLHVGMPVDPGNLLMLGKLGATPVVGVPTCARSPKENGFDWVLNRLLSDVEVAPEDIMDMGAGGLLAEIALRPQPRLGESVKPQRPRIAAVVLAAGLSSRMGSNKILAELDGKPLLVRTLLAIKASAVDEIVVVTGHQAQEVEAAVAELNVRVVCNPDFAAGLAGSVKVGIAAVAAFEAAFVCLGDMPLVRAQDLDRMIAAYSVDDQRDLIVPFLGRKMGNPVLWGRDYFAALQSLTGDRGARGLLEASRDSITEVSVEHEGILLDADTPEALAKIRSLANF